MLQVNFRALLASNPEHGGLTPPGTMPGGASFAKRAAIVVKTQEGLPPMKLFHVSPRAYSVSRSGLNPAYATGKMQAVWLCTFRLIPWALDHVSRHHGLPVKRFYLLEVDVPRAWLVRRRFGIYTCSRPIPKSWIRFASVSC